MASIQNQAKRYTDKSKWQVIFFAVAKYPLTLVARWKRQEPRRSLGEGGLLWRNFIGEFMNILTKILIFTLGLGASASCSALSWNGCSALFERYVSPWVPCVTKWFVTNQLERFNPEIEDLRRTKNGLTKTAQQLDARLGAFPKKLDDYNRTFSDFELHSGQRFNQVTADAAAIFARQKDINEALAKGRAAQSEWNAKLTVGIERLRELDKEMDEFKEKSDEAFEVINKQQDKTFAHLTAFVNENHEATQKQLEGFRHTLGANGKDIKELQKTMGTLTQELIKLRSTRKKLEHETDTIYAMASQQTEQLALLNAVVKKKKN